jgi:hypothetical protein
MITDIERFLAGIGTDGVGRRIDQILDFDDVHWDRTHDFIQWLFPLTEASRSVRNAPILTDDEITQIRESESAQANIQRSVLRYKEFLAGTTKWRNGYDHNHLRISRVIKSLRLLVSDEAANGFKYWVAGQLGDQIDSIHAESRRHWRLS